MFFNCPELLFLKGMTGAFAPFSYIVYNSKLESLSLLATLEPTMEEPIMDRNSKGKLLTLSASIRQGYKWLSVTYWFHVVHDYGIDNLA